MKHTTNKHAKPNIQQNHAIIKLETIQETTYIYEVMTSSVR